MVNPSTAIHNQDGSDAVPPTTRPTISYYLVLVLLVIPFCAVTPASWCYVVYSLYTGSIRAFTSRQYVVFAVALAEVLFSVYHYNLAKFVSGPSPIQPPGIVDLQDAFRRVLQSGLAGLPEDGPYDAETLDYDHPGSATEFITNLAFDDPRAVDFRSYMRTWFKKAPWSAIHKHELQRWLYWSTFNVHMPSPESMPTTHRQVIDEAVKLVEKRSGCKIPEGSNPAVTPMLLTVDDIHISFRPFLWYAFVAVGHTFAHRFLEHHWGVEFGRHGDVEYMVRIPENWDPTDSKARPIVFLHGLGLGIIHYSVFIIKLLQRFSDRPLLIPLHPHVSQRIFHPTYVRPLGRRSMVEGIFGAMREYGFVPEDDESNEVTVGDPRTGVTVLSHSNGSFTHAWMLKASPHLISRSCFVDPVTFCLWEGDVCYNFLYKIRKTGFEMLMYYFVCSEIGIANFLHRHFDWSANSLWYEEIPHGKDPSKSMFVLGGKDFIVNSDRVAGYLKSHGVKKGLLYTPEHTHGQAFIGGSDVFKQIMDWLEEP